MNRWRLHGRLQSAFVFHSLRLTFLESLPVAVIGAGPVGFAAAAHLHRYHQPFVVLEAGAEAGAAIRRWGHVRTFSPWRYMVDGAARED